ncbi:MAG: class I SAM-dependent methyltransferase [Chloroflexi bacterium]|nr:class I SAM-dependent methyltransferase [Chloroflexota bacterium]
MSTPEPVGTRVADVPICNYEGSTYRTDFWEGKGREYEDAVERVALRALLPAWGERLIELGAGYGRLADLYAGFERVVLTDRALTQVQQARRLRGSDPRFAFVVCDAYALPFKSEAVTQVVSVRMLHHLVDVPRALVEIARIIAPGGAYVTEFASKRHLKSIFRWLLRRQQENPFSPEPHEFVALNFDFHPRWMEQQMARAGFAIDARRAVSHFRVGLLKRFVPLRLLVAADRALQRVGGWWPWTPSLFVCAHKR